MLRFDNRAHGLNYAAWLVEDAAATSQLAGVVVGVAKRGACWRYAGLGDEAIDILAMVEHLDAVETVALTKDP